MKSKSIAAIFVVLVSAIAFSVSIALTQTKKATAQVRQQTTQNQQQNTSTVVYKYIAQPGDSYSKMARKAIQTYGIKNKVNISNAKILFAETNITQQAGSPFLDLSQNVEIKESVVKDWVEKAQKITITQEAAWDAYSSGVDFNTNNVGQAS